MCGESVHAYGDAGMRFTLHETGKTAQAMALIRSVNGIVWWGSGVLEFRWGFCNGIQVVADEGFSGPFETPSSDTTAFKHVSAVRRVERIIRESPNRMCSQRSSSLFEV